MKKLNFRVFDSTFLPKVSQSFISLEGEGQNIGEPSLYIRLAGCYSAACKFCDTKFSWYNKKKFKYIIENWEDDFEITKNNPSREINRLTITGGEPLHYMNSFPVILEKIKSKKFQDIGIKINWLGIESNGNILNLEKNLFNLIKIFKELKNEFEVDPILTISPKIDPELCYNNILDKKTVRDMYHKVFENIFNFFTFEVNYKFIWNFLNPEMNGFALEMIDTLRKKFFVKNKYIYLMPFTPFDPLGKNKEVWEQSKDETARMALELGVRYSPRIHIDRKLD